MPTFQFFWIKISGMDKSLLKDVDWNVTHVRYWLHSTLKFGVILCKDNVQWVQYVLCIKKRRTHFLLLQPSITPVPAQIILLWKGPPKLYIECYLVPLWVFLPKSPGIIRIIHFNPLNPTQVRLEWVFTPPPPAPLFWSQELCTVKANQNTKRNFQKSNL